VEEIPAIEKVKSNEEYKEDDDTLLTPDVGELLVIWEPFMPKSFPLNLAKGSKSSTLGALLEARYENSSSMEVVAPMWLLAHSWKSFKFLSRRIPVLTIFNGSSKEMR